LSIRNSMSENGSEGKYLLERVKSITIERVELLGNVLLDKVC